MAPTILKAKNPYCRIAQEETFGPVAVFQVARDFDEALDVANAVRHGLIAAICGGTPSELAAFTDRAQAGMLNLSHQAMAIDLSAPFVGWKESAVGIPEHGRWDREFYSQAQVVYGR